MRIRKHLRGYLTHDYHVCLDILSMESSQTKTRHRWCLWHILKKVPEKLRRYAEYHDIRVSLHSVVYNSLTLVEFEEAWHDMLDKYDLGNNQWLNSLYEERNRWVPCFVKITL